MSSVPDFAKTFDHIQEDSVGPAHLDELRPAGVLENNYADLAAIRGDTHMQLIGGRSHASPMDELRRFTESPADKAYYDSMTRPIDDLEVDFE